jgi:hypothetical protein
VPDLSFQVEGAEAVPYAAAPLIAFKLRVTNAGPDEPIQNIALRAQIQIESLKRRYVPDDQAGLLDLFGEPDRWSQTLRTMLWTHANITVPPFTGSVVVDLPVPCTFDFNIGATKYFYALSEGDVPLMFLFSGTVFYQDADWGLRVTQIPWEKEAAYRLPIGVWRQMMDIYYPNSAWLRLRQDVFDRLYAYKSRRGLATWEQALDSLLEHGDT